MISLPGGFLLPIALLVTLLALNIVCAKFCEDLTHFVACENFLEFLMKSNMAENPIFTSHLLQRYLIFLYCYVMCINALPTLTHWADMELGE